MYVRQRNVQKWMFRLGCPSKVKEGIETIVPIKDQQQTPTPPFFWTFALNCRPSISLPIKQAPSKCRTAGWAASKGSMPPEFWWIPFSKAWYTEVEASLGAGRLALAGWCVPNRWPVTSCKKSKQYTAWANVQPLLLHHATRIVMWHWSSNYQYHQIPTDCAMPSTGRKNLVASCIGCLANACKSWSLVSQWRIAGDGLVVSHSQPSSQLSSDTPLQFSNVITCHRIHPNLILLSHTFHVPTHSTNQLSPIVPWEQRCHPSPSAFAATTGHSRTWEC